MRTMKIIVEAEETEWDNIFFEDYVKMYLIDETNNDHEIMSGDSTHDDIYHQMLTFIRGISYIEGKVNVEYYAKTESGEEVYMESEII